ncbi:MAG: hypothetical protein HY301_03510 [Verrucomicrobia bacterium]|nr:hypothetical protein [Verrucomicrobiota bacterium]
MAMLALGAFCAAGLIVWPGCLSVPLPSSRKSISKLKPADFSFRKDAHPSRSEIVSRAGEPDKYFPEVRVACYKLNEITRSKLMLFLILPMGTEANGAALEVAMIQYDDRDQVRRVEIKELSINPTYWDVAVKQWTAEPAKGTPSVKRPGAR